MSVAVQAAAAEDVEKDAVKKKELPVGGDVPLPTYWFNATVPTLSPAPLLLELKLPPLDPAPLLLPVLDAPLLDPDPPLLPEPDASPLEPELAPALPPELLPEPLEPAPPGPPSPGSPPTRTWPPQPMATSPRANKVVVTMGRMWIQWPVPIGFVAVPVRCPTR